MRRLYISLMETIKLKRTGNYCKGAMYRGMERCEHAYELEGYNTSIVIEKCKKCGDEIEIMHDDYVEENGFPENIYSI